MVWDGCWTIYDRINKGYNYDNPELKCDQVNEKIKGEKEMEMENNVNFGNDANAGNIAEKLISERKLYGNRMGINDSLCNTNLISKNYSPMFIRKYNSTVLNNWPLYVSMICDEDVSDLDQIVNETLKKCKEAGMAENNIQQMRNITGILSETISEYYNSKKENCVEGIGILLAIDKAMICNLSGDYMNHAMCRSEFYSVLNMMPHI